MRTDIKVAPLPADWLPSGSKSSTVIIGPPGTGKTTAAVRIAADWIAAGHDPASVLVCTFSRAAAGELRKRLGLDDPDEAREVCSTIHSEARRLVSERRKVSLYTWPPLADHTRAYSYARAMRIDFKDAIGPTGAGPYSLAKIEETRRQMEEAGELDFDDLLELALLEPAKRRSLLIVDETQDNSGVQWDLVDKWSAAADHTIIIGDPDQTIHKWRGAASGELERRIETQDAYFLSKSFRRPPRAVHEHAVRIVERIKNRPSVSYQPADHVGEVARSTFRRMTEHFRGQHMLLLARTNRQAAEMATAFNAAGIFVEGGGVQYWKTPYKAVLARNILRGGGDSLRRDLAEALGTLVPAKHWSTKKKDGVPFNDPPEPWTIIADGANCGTAAAADGVRADIERAGYALRDLEPAGLAVDIADDDLADAADDANDACVVSTDDLPFDWQEAKLPAWADTPLGDAIDGTPFRVKAMTIHKAKGLEAHTVLVWDEAPKSVMRSIRENRDDERRLMYVACTRAIEKLVIVQGTPSLEALL